MEETITIQNSEMPLVLQKAIVIHANKYSKATGSFSYIVFSTLHTEAVFRLEDTNEDLHMHFTNVDLPIYNGESVRLISVAGTVLGYIDMKTKLYYYTSRNLGKDLGLVVPFYLVWIIGLAGGLIIGYFEGSPTFLVFAPFVCIWLFYITHSMILTYKIKSAIDKILM